MTKRTYRRRRRSNQPLIDRNGVLVLVGFALIIAGLLTFWAYFSVDQRPLITRWLSFLRDALGWAAYLVPILFIGIGGLLLQQTARRPWRWPWGESIGLVIVLAASLALTHLFTDTLILSCSSSRGGAVGCWLGNGLSYLFGRVVSIILYGLGAVVGLLLVLHIPFRRVSWLLGTLLVWIASMARRIGTLAVTGWHQLRAKRPRELQLQPLPTPVLAPSHPVEPVIDKTVAVQDLKPKPDIVQRAAIVAETDVISDEGAVKAARDWKLPGIKDMLTVRQDSQMSLADIRAKARLIEQTLQSLGVPAKVVEVNPGPVVTQFGIEPGFVEKYDRDGEVQLAKVKVSRIAALSNDLALALAASPIRIEAPVPGKGIVGLEVPNGQSATVGLRGVIESPEFAAANSKLAMALGKDVSGTAVVADLLQLPHMLIAGATNSGKSVCLNAIITCFLLHNTPDELKLILVDPKRVELSQYSGIPHLLAPVVVEPDRVLGVLNWLAREMDRRYNTFAAAGARNIQVYNANASQRGMEKLPYIVLVMDELADLMIVSPDEVERAICRLAQMARATGIHLVLATQRPSVDVVTGLIKANFPARMAFAVTSQIDSRVILDTPGAEKLLGRGDGLLMAPNTPQLVRVQGCWVSESELSRLVQYWRAQADAPAKTDTAAEPSGPIIQQALWPEVGQDEQADPAESEMLAKAREVIHKSGKASVSLLQRNLGIGYTRAARIIDQLEKEGFIGPATGTSKPREILPEIDKET
ncbi:MAG: FtsK/SpoIIIE family DNA translocase [Anaerolineae bacterium]